jgi:outer membrane biosynthesis protein TonB
MKKMKGGQYMELYSDTSKDWHNKGSVPNLAVNLDVGINEYMFGRTTPNNNFIVSTGLVKKPYGVEMIGGSKKKVVDEKKPKKKIVEDKPKKKTVDEKKSKKKTVNETKSKKKPVDEKKPKKKIIKDEKSESIINKIKKIINKK